MELKVGMYVRTKYGINKIYKTFYTISGINHSYIDLENCYIDDENDLRQGINIENIIKASFNIIDLIEVGDYVNGFKVDEVVNRNDFKCVIHYYPYDEEYCEENEIKSVLTKEQFEQMKYKIGE